MTPDFRIIADETDITETLRPRLLSLSVSDEVGLQSDALELALDDRDGKIEIPPLGVTLSVYLGYRPSLASLGQTLGGLTYLGTFAADEVETSGPPDTLYIRATAADMGGDIKSQRNRHWHDATISDIATAIAAAHELTAKVADDLGAIRYEHLDQSNESDIQLLTRIATDHDAIATIKNGVLILTPKGAGLSVSGKTLPPRAVLKTDLTSWSVTQITRANYKSVVAAYHDMADGERKEVTAGNGSPTQRVRQVYKSEAAARRAAKAKLDEVGRAQDRFRCSLPGAPDIQAGGVIETTGFKAALNTKWTVRRITHRLSSGGFLTTLEAEKPTSQSSS